MRKLAIFLLLSILMSVIFAHDGYVRNLSADILHYQFSIALNDTTDRIVGNALIEVRFINETDSLMFDFKSLNSSGTGMKVTDVSLNGQRLNWKHRNDKLTIFFGMFVKRNDTLEFAVDYNGVPSDGLIISKNRFGDRTFFADHWPDRAHNYLPCVDHPYDKATVDFIITTPGHYRVVASGSLVEESALGANRTLTHWRESVPIATKVMTFGASGFAMHSEGSVSGVPVSSWVFPENRSEGFKDFSIAVRPLDYYIKTIGNFPYEKLANVQSKTIYGGLENAGTIFYSENSVTGQGRAEGLIAHEEAHQWFGDCITEADWHHIWLSEGFATYLTSVYFESLYGRKRLESDMIAARERVIKFYEKKGSPVIDTTITDLMKLLNPNSYQKGAWVLHMLRNEVGDDAFFASLRLFYKRFYNSNALTADFRKVIEDVSGKNLDTFFKQWLYIAGQPDLRIWKEPGKKKNEIEICIEQKQDYLFEFNIELLIKDSAGERTENVFIRDRLVRKKIKAGNDAIILPDPHINLLFRTLQ